MPTRRALAATLCIMGAAGAGPIRAQGARGAGPDARTPPAGTLRIGVGLGWDRNGEAYDDGRPAELGARFSVAALGPAVLPYMAPAESAARIASGLPDLAASLGTSIVHARRSTDATPAYAEFGITSRLAAGIVVPFVTAAARVDVQVNPLGAVQATFGLNPALGSATIAAATGTLVTQLAAAGAYVTQQIATCTATPGAAGCGPYVASPGTAQQLVTTAAQFADAVTTLYGTGTASGLPFVPLAGGSAQAAVVARLAGLKAQFATFGAPPVSAAAPVGAPAPLTGDQLQGVLTDPAFGVASTGLVPVVRRGVGNVELNAQYTLHDSHREAPSDTAVRATAWWRAGIGAAYRLGSGRQSAPADLLAVDAGEAMPAVVLRGVGEFGLGPHYALAAEVALTARASVETSVRVPRSAGDIFPLPDQELRLGYSPGAEVLTTIAPRWTPNDAIALAALYSYRAKAADTYTVRGAVMATANTPADATILSANSDAREHRFGAAIAYSTVASFDAGHARWPVEISFSHFQTTAASGSGVPKLAHDAVTLRWYWAPFRRERR